MNRFFVLCACLGIVLGLAGHFLMDNSKQVEPTPKPIADLSQLSVDREARFWAQMIERAGGKGAYSSFLLTYADQPYPIQHGMMHLFGSQLYKKLGLDGIGVCDSSFGFGCYHQISMDAIVASGAGVIPVLEKKCLINYGQRRSGLCVHGIGHGLVEYFGGNYDALLGALNICSVRMSNSRSKRYCSAGAFMEYQKLPFWGDFSEPLPLDAKNPAGLCGESMPQEYRADCYKSLGPWWIKAEKNDARAAFLLCASVPDDSLPFCYMGIGIAIPPEANFLLNEVVISCDKAPDPKARSYCVAGASRAFIMYKNQDHSNELCKDIQEDVRPLCTYE